MPTFQHFRVTLLVLVIFRTPENPHHVEGNLNFLIRPPDKVTSTTTAPVPHHFWHSADNINYVNLTSRENECVHSPAMPHHQYLEVISEQNDCVSMFELPNCTGNHLQFHNLIRSKFRLNIEGSEFEHNRLLNFILKPTYFQVCQPFHSPAINKTPGQQSSKLGIQLSTSEKTSPTALGVSADKCTNLPLPPKNSHKRHQAHLWIVPDDYASPANPLCIEMYPEKDCKGNGSEIRFIIPPQSFNSGVQHFGPSMQIWEFYSDTNSIPSIDTAVNSVKRCLYTSQPLPTPPGTSAQLQQSVAGSNTPKTPNCSFWENIPTTDNDIEAFTQDVCPRQSCQEICVAEHVRSKSSYAFCQCVCFNPESTEQLSGSCIKHLIIFDESGASNKFHEELLSFTKSTEENNGHNLFPQSHHECATYILTSKGVELLRRKRHDEFKANSTSSSEDDKKDVVKTVVPWVAGGLAVIMVLVVLILVFLLWRKKKRVREARSRQCVPTPRRFTNANTERVLNVHQVDPIEQNDYEDDITGLHAICRSFAGAEFEIPRGNIDIGNIRDSTASIIGVGEFSIVFKGRLRTPNRMVAVKTMKSCQATPKALKSALRECQIFMQLGKQHEGILEFIGVCTESVRKGEILMLMEFCEGGSLKTFLAHQRSHFVNLIEHEEILIDENTMAEVQCPIETGPPVRFNTFQLFKWCWEVADAMEFLAVRKVVHMSLCTKNVLLDSNFSIKLSDFYFARTGDDNRSGVPSSYFNRANTNKDRLVPWRWFAIESLLDDIFSIESDIWAYGVVMWEIFTLGATPYPEYTYGGEFTLCIKHGYRLLKPAFASLPSYELMLLCWYDAPEKRPSFTKIKSKLATMVPKSLC